MISFRYNAACAVDFWTAVIDRTGNSKFPVDKACEEREKAKALFRAAEQEDELERMRLSGDVLSDV